MVSNESIDQKRGRLAKRQKIAQHMLNLEANPDFQVWRELEVDTRLDLLKKQILEADMSDPVWREKACADIQAYQATKRAFDSCFTSWQRIYNDSKDKLKELS